MPEVAAGPEWRLRAHIGALAAGGRRVTARLLQPALEGEEPELRTAAALAALAPGEGQDAALVVAALVAADDATRPSLARGLALGAAPVEALVARHLESDDAGLLAAALEVLAFRHAALGDRPARLAGHRDPRVASAALAALRHAPGPAAAAVAAPLLGARHPVVRSAAIALGLVCGLRPALEACREEAEKAGPSGRQARLALAQGGDDDDLARLLGLAEGGPLRRDALWALGFSGRLAAADACLAHLGDDEVGGVAAEAFVAITGLSLRGRQLRAPPPERDDGALPPLEEDLADDLLPGVDADLPLARPDLVAAWWAEARKAHDPKVRLMRGRPFDLGGLRAELGHGPARRRGALAWELGIRSRGAVQVEARHLSATQARQLEAAAGQRTGTSYTRPYGVWMTG